MAKGSHSKQSALSFVKHHVVMLTTIMQVISVVMLNLCAASVYVSPAKWSWASVVGLAFPALIAAVVAMGIVVLCIAPRRIWITAVGLLTCFGSIRNYAPLNYPTPHPEGAWHLMTWNVGGVTSDNETIALLEDYLIDQNLDLLCLQEVSSKQVEFLEKALSPNMPYKSMNLVQAETVGVCLFTRWPVIDSCIVSQNALNMVQATRLLLAPADTLHIINCHLQSTHIDLATRSDFAAVMHREQTNSDTMTTTTLNLMRKIRTNSEVRAMQANAVAQYVEQHKGDKIIVMGDFNDTPISYSRQHIIEAADLMDCFRDSGNGISRTFNRNAFYVRIDHIFASPEHYTSYETRTDTSHLSDHYPVSTYLMPKGSDTLH